MLNRMSVTVHSNISFSFSLRSAFFPVLSSF